MSNQAAGAGLKAVVDAFAVGDYVRYTGGSKADDKVHRPEFGASGILDPMGWNAMAEGDKVPVSTNRNDSETRSSQEALVLVV